MKQKKYANENAQKPIFSECLKCKYFCNFYSKLNSDFTKTDFGLCTKHNEIVVKDDYCNNFTELNQNKKE